MIAGLGDAGLASFATFVSGLYVVRVWADAPENIGVYALFFAAMGMATTLSTQLVFIPAEKHMLDLSPGVRRRLLPRTLVRTLPVAVLAGLPVLAPTLWVMSRGGHDQLLVPLATAAFVVYIVSPMQDHARRVLHMDGASWLAAAVSAVQVVAAAAALAAIHFWVVNPAWAAFGALAIANSSSLTFAVVVAFTRGRDPDASEARDYLVTVRISNLFRAGRWLSTAGVISTAVNFAVSAAVVALVGEAALGYAEAARTIAQPIVVVSMGLRAVFGPSSMQGAKLRDRAMANRVSNLFMAVLWPITATYVLLFGIAWDYNFLVGLAPAAYVVSGLVSLTALANCLNGATFPLRLELVGADRESTLFTTDVIANLLMLTASVLMAMAGTQFLVLAAMARPFGMAVLGLSRWVLYRVAVASHYTADPVGAVDTT